MCFTFIFLIINGLIGIPSKLFVSIFFSIADDVLRTPDVCVDFFFVFSIPAHFDSQDCSLVASAVAAVESTILTI